MSALDQKQTFAPRKIMSALPPKANLRFHPSRARTDKIQGASITPTPALVRIHESSKAYAVGPTARPGVQIRHGNAHHRYRTARLRTESMPSCRTNRGQSTLHRRHNNK